ISLESGRSGLLPYLQELALEYQSLRRMSERHAQRGDVAGSKSPEAQRCLTHLIRSVNLLINFIDNTGLVQDPLDNARRARSWLQMGLEGEQHPEQEVVQFPPNFPYQRLPDGSYEIIGSKLNLLLLGDNDGTRTFQLGEQGHRVTHIGYDEARIRTTERRLQFRTERRKRSGEWEFDPDIRFQTAEQPPPPADLIEAYFPPVLAELPPRDTSERGANLQDFLERSINRNLSDGGKAFIMSERDDAVEDLANLVLRTPGLSLLELRLRRSNLPLQGGSAVAAEPGESMVSWLVLERATTPNP
ncbi:MAG: hypothetical protein K8R69_12235, partial [Deltaproteobacteria bacterium]|nr:hypothetical protein [Deltaproteobacteria bacterium]